jgi:hypothetical protein
MHNMQLCSQSPATFCVGHMRRTVTASTPKKPCTNRAPVHGPGQVLNQKLIFTCGAPLWQCQLPCTPTRLCNLHSQSTPVAVLYSSTQAPSKRRVENVVKASAPPLAAELLAMRVEPASTAVVRESSATTPPWPPGTYGRHHIQRQKKIKNSNKLPQQRNTKETLPLWRRAATSVISQQ